MFLGKGFACATVLILSAVALPAQTVQGIPINDDLTIRKCGGCHQKDANGMMRRISYIRTTPEVWEQSIKRMIRLNGLSATPQEVHAIVRYLSNNNGLAPEEMKPGFWEVEHRTEGYQDDYVPNQALQHTCNYCHSIGRVLAQRRTRDDYDKLVAMHIGLFPGAANAFRPQRARAVRAAEAPQRQSPTANGGVAMEAPRAPAAPNANAKYPVDLALDYLVSAQPLITPEWTAWHASMRSPKLAGTWLLTGYQPGRGKIYGQMVVTPGSSGDQFVTNAQYTYASNGTTVKLSGKSIVYTGYSWRGSAGAVTPHPAGGANISAVPVQWREAMMVSREGNSMDGRFFWSSFGELGIDVHLVRLGSEPVVLGADLASLQSPSKHELKIYGGNLPSSLKPSDIDLGPGVSITKIVNSSPTIATVEVDVAKGLPIGIRDLSVGRATAVKALAVYDKIAYVKITPNAQISRLGGVVHPKELAQFDVIAYAAGPDGKANTADDVALGPVSAKWSLEEFFSTPDDDDIKFVGTVDDSGLFTPNIEGPNPDRKKQDNNFPVDNYGDVWVVADYKAPDGAQLKAKSYLVVTVPNYTIYDQPEVGQ